MSEIYDLGYKRYAGARRGQGSRWIVIARNQVGLAWKGWVRWKLAFALAVIATVVVGAMLVTLADERIRALEVLSGSGHAFVTFADGIIPFAMAEIYTRICFVLALTCGTLIVASDIQGGAMVFYFARSVRPRDYALGKIAGYAFVTGSIMLAGPVLLAALRIGLAATSGSIVSQLVVLPKVIAVGLAATIVYAAVPIAFSAIAANKRYAVGTYAAYVVVIGSIASVLGAASNTPLGIIDFGNAVSSLVYHLFDVRLPGASPLPMWAAVTSIATFTVISIVLLFSRLREEGSAGVGGES